MEQNAVGVAMIDMLVLGVRNDVCENRVVEQDLKDGV